MKRLQRIAIFGLLFVLLCAGVSEALAQESSLQVSIVCDRDAYASDEAAEMTVSVRNASDQPLKNIRLEHILPEGLVYTYDSEEEFRFGVIMPGETVTKAVRVRREDHAVQFSVYADKENYKEDEFATLTVKAKNLSKRAISNLNIRHILPNGLAYADPSQGAGRTEILLSPGERKEFSVMVKKIPETLRIMLEADKAEYQKTDIAQITIAVENISDQLVSNLNIEHLLPNGLRYVPGKEEHEFRRATIYPHETVKYTVYVQHVGEVPNTGDRSGRDMLLYTAALLISAALLGLMKAKTKRQRSEV